MMDYLLGFAVVVDPDEWWICQIKIDFRDELRKKARDGAFEVIFDKKNVTLCDRNLPVNSSALQGVKTTLRRKPILPGNRPIMSIHHPSTPSMEFITMELAESES